METQLLPLQPLGSPLGAEERGVSQQLGEGHTLKWHLCVYNGESTPPGDSHCSCHQLSTVLLRQSVCATGESSLACPRTQEVDPRETDKPSCHSR